MAYEWRNNPACVATYKILEGDQFLNLFEVDEFPFDQAGAVTMAQLHILPGSTSTFNDLIAEQFGLKFVKFVDKNFTKEKENPAEKKSKIAQELAKIFIKKTATVRELAEAADKHFKFPNEV